VKEIIALSLSLSLPLSLSLCARKRDKRGKRDFAKKEETLILQTVKSGKEEAETS
jgi:hypothetical protein